MRKNSNNYIRIIKLKSLATIALTTLILIINSACTKKDIPPIIRANKENREFNRKLKKEEVEALEIDKNAEKKLKEAGIKIEKDRKNEDVELKRLKQRKKRFNNTLKREYLKLSETLSTKNNYSDASYFRRKAYRTDTHLDILPEDPANWKIKSDIALNNLRLARVALIDTLTFNVITVAPKAAAQAISNYDCWLEQRKNNWVKYENNCKESFKKVQEYLKQIHTETQGKSINFLKRKYKFIDLEEDYKAFRIKPKREHYEGAYDKKIPTVKHLDMNVNVTNPMVVEIEAKPVDSSIEQATKKVAKAENSGFIIQDRSTGGEDLLYVAYFEDGNEELGSKAKSEIEKALLEINKAKPKVIILNGHTDRSFSTQESLKLSKTRADKVRQYLTEKNINKEIIKTYGFGKTDNIVDNPEGAKQPANNRVEIIFKGSK